MIPLLPVFWENGLLGKQKNVIATFYIALSMEKKESKKINCIQRGFQVFNNG
jgi:hypothetical protein